MESEVVRVQLVRVAAGLQSAHKDLGEARVPRHKALCQFVIHVTLDCMCDVRAIRGDEGRDEQRDAVEEESDERKAIGEPRQAWSGTEGVW